MALHNARGNDNAAIDMEGRVALYIEGSRCAFSQATLSWEDGGIPMLQIQVPATTYMRNMRHRVRVHLLFREFVFDQWVVLFEGEILQRGFQKDVENRYVSFVAHHVVGHLDQYAISALTLGDKLSEEIKGTREVGEVMTGTQVFGSFLEVFTPDRCAKALAEIDETAQGDPTNPNLPDYIRGAYAIYKVLIENHRIRDSYPHRAVEWHRLFRRLIVPDGQQFSWSATAQNYLLSIQRYANEMGSRMTFMDFLRFVAQNFLHQITIAPNAQSWRHQIQFKPQTVFNAIPPCNVVHPCMVDAYAFAENYAERPTRMEARFVPTWMGNEAANAPVFQALMTFWAPNELQYLWSQIRTSIASSVAAPAESGAEGGAGQPANAPSAASKAGAAVAGGGQYDAIIAEASSKFNVPVNLIKAIIQVESGGNPNLTSPAGARGLMQLMPATAAGLGVTNSFDPRQNIMGGTKYLAQISKSKGRNWDIVSYAYNAGPGHGSYPRPNKENRGYWPKVKAVLDQIGGLGDETPTSPAKGELPNPKRPSAEAIGLPLSSGSSIAKDGIKFVTFEEEGKGIVSGYYDIPPALNYVIMQIAQGVTSDKESNPLGDLGGTEAERLSQADKFLNSPSAEARQLKYRAFLCLALGDGGGFKPNQFNKTMVQLDTSDRLRYRQRRHELFKLMADKAFLDRPDVNPYIHPTRIVLMPLNVNPVVQATSQNIPGVGPAKVIRNKAELLKTGVNFFIDKSGHIIQVLPRFHNTFCQPQAVPFGVQVQNLGDGDAMDINRAMVPLIKVEGKDLERKRVRAIDLPIIALPSIGFPKDVTPRVERTVQKGALTYTDTVVILVSPDQVQGTEREKLPDGSEWTSIVDGKTQIFVHDYFMPPLKLAPLNKHVTVELADYINIGNGQEAFLMRVSEPVFLRGGRTQITVKTDGGRAFSKVPGRPWRVMPANVVMPAGYGRLRPKKAVSMQALNTAKATTGFLGPDMTSGGPVGAVAIGFESTNGSVTQAAADAAAWLCAVIAEMTTESLGQGQNVPKSPQERTKDAGVTIGPEDIHQITDYFYSESYRPLTLGAAGGDPNGLVNFIRQQMPAAQNKLFADFNVFDKKLTGGGVVDYTNVETARDTGENADEDTLPADTSSLENSAIARENKAGAEAAKKGGIGQETGAKLRTEAVVASLEDVIDGFAAAILNYQFYNMRYANQNFTAPMVFNPYMMVGYPALVLDNSDAKYNLVAYVHGIAHTFTESSAATSVTLTHVRQGTDPSQRLIPYKERRTQYFYFNIPKEKPGEGDEFQQRFNYALALSNESAKQEYLKALETAGFKIDKTHPYARFPVNLMNWKGDKAPPPFVYDGGFGLGASKEGEKGNKKPEPDGAGRYDKYLLFTGYVDPDGKPDALAVGLSNDGQTTGGGSFIFGDSAVFQFKAEVNEDIQLEGQGASGEAALIRGTQFFDNQENDILIDNAVEAYRAVYRQIQAVNQPHQGKKGESLVLFDEGEGVVPGAPDNPRYAVAPRRIKVLREDLGSEFFDEKRAPATAVDPKQSEKDKAEKGLKQSLDKILDTGEMLKKLDFSTKEAPGVAMFKFNEDVRLLVELHTRACEGRRGLRG